MRFTKNSKVSTKVQRYTAFTLAEVLITLTIIGVVATITIPALMNNINDMQYKVSLKKVFSILSQAQLSIANNNGGNFQLALTSCANATCFKNIFKTVLNSTSDCPVGANLGVCFPALANLTYLNGTNTGGYLPFAASTSGLVLNDGMMVSFYLDSNSCNFARTAFADECGWVLVDVNGFKNPNKLGKDIYILFIRQNQITPFAAGSDTFATGNTNDDCNVGVNLGYSCAADYIIGN